jgi:hypothetical protein
MGQLAEMFTAAGRPRFAGKIYGADNIKRHLQRKKSIHARDAETSIADVNRNTDEPHQHSREAARRARQMARVK